jgi:hypothetical protein
MMVPLTGHLPAGRPAGEGRPGVHLAVVSEPYLTQILGGIKTIESRFSMREVPPFRCVAEGDILFLKKGGAPVTGVCRVSRVWFHRLDPERYHRIIQEHAVELSVDSSPFWHEKESALFCTLMELEDVRPITPTTLRKTDRRGWVVLRRAVHPYQRLLREPKQGED